MTDNSNTHRTLPRRTVLRRGLATGALAVGGLFVTDSTSAQGGGSAYLKEQHRRGKNNADEERFQIVEPCWTDDVDLPCDGNGEKTYTAYKIRCPNYPGGGPGAQDHENGCGGGGHDGRCGRHILVNENRNIPTGGLYEFTAVRECGDGYVKAAFRPA